MKLSLLLIFLIHWAQADVSSLNAPDTEMQDIQPDLSMTLEKTEGFNTLNAEDGHQMAQGSVLSKRNSYKNMQRSFLDEATLKSLAG